VQFRIQLNTSGKQRGNYAAPINYAAVPARVSPHNKSFAVFETRRNFLVFLTYKNTKKLPETKIAQTATSLITLNIKKYKCP
jgi:hypothetical protein